MTTPLAVPSRLDVSRQQKQVPLATDQLSLSRTPTAEADGRSGASASPAGGLRPQMSVPPDPGVLKDGAAHTEGGAAARCAGVRES